MSFNNLTINFSIAVSAQQAPATLQKLLEVFSSDTMLVSSAPVLAAANEHVSPKAGTWPSIPADADVVYRDIAEGNLRRLKASDIPDQGWGAVKDLAAALNSLRSETRKVVLRAIENGGHISRREVYAVLERNPSQSLKGFTKPAVSLAEELISKGELLQNAVPLLTPIYKQSKTYQKAQGFAVPIQVVSLMIDCKNTTS